MNKCTWKEIHKQNFAFMTFRGVVLTKFSYLKRSGHICGILQNKLSNSILKPQKLSITYSKFVVCFDSSVQDLEIGRIWLSNWYERYEYSNKHNMNIRKWATIRCQVLQHVIDFPKKRLYVGLIWIETICNWMKNTLLLPSSIFHSLDNCFNLIVVYILWFCHNLSTISLIFSW